MVSTAQVQHLAGCGRTISLLSSLEFPYSTSYYDKPGGVDTESKHTLTL